MGCVLRIARNCAGMAAVAEKPEFACFNALSATVSQKDTKMNRFLRLRIAGLAAAAFVLQSGVAIAQPPAMAVVSPDVHPDRTVTFRIPAPNAKQVSVGGEFDRHPVGLTKDDAGVWSVTIGPLKPNVYGYGFSVDGFNTPDPSNTFVRVGSLAFQSQVEIPGEEEAYQA